MPACAPHRAPARLALLVVSLLLPALLGACGATPGASDGGIAGTGDVVSELRDLGPFTRVSVAGGLKVIIGEAATQSVQLDAQRDLLPAIRTEVRDGQLIVTIPSPGVSATKPMSLTLKMTEVQSVSLSNGANGYVEHTGGPLNVDVSGGAELTAIGETTGLTLSAIAGSHAKLGQLTAQEARITINDGASAELHVVGALTGTADGGSTVVLTAKPTSNDVKTTSGASIQGG
jgi:hypothetical protein